MKALLLVVIGLLSAGVSWGVDAKNMEKMLKATGGFVCKPGTQTGEIVYVNCQKTAEREWIAENISYLSDLTRCKITLKNGEFNVLHPTRSGNITIFVIDEPAMPTLLCAPEEPWAAVNVARLKSDKPAFFSARVKKELSRAFAMICGAAASKYKDTLFVPIRNVEDLDRHVDQRLPADVVANFSAYMKEFGVTGAFKATYKLACKQGWAAAPTNEYQKVIWQQVKAEANTKPTNPLKIRR